MTDEKLIKEGLNGKDSLKIILSGYVDKSENENTEEKVGVVSVMFVSENKELVVKKIEEFEAKYPERYFMVYSVPLDTNLEELNHYPSIVIFQSDLNQINKLNNRKPSIILRGGFFVNRFFVKCCGGLIFQPTFYMWFEC